MTDVRWRARDETPRYIPRIVSLILQAHLTPSIDTPEALAELL
jgi:hypothetical protein